MRLSLTLLGLFFLLALSAQDQHFSQFYASPLTLNPALTGMLEGKYRVSMVYRDQWRNSLDNPYQTYSAAADFRYPVRQYKKRYRDAIGVGFLFYNDKINAINFTTNQLMIAAAYHKALNPESNQFLSLGVQLGMMQRNINYDQLTFDDQFNGTNGFDQPTDELFVENNFATSDVQIGLHYTYSPQGGLGIYAGAAMHHVFEPEMSWYYRAQDPSMRDERLSSTLYRKYSAHIGLRIPIGEATQFLPRTLVYTQGPHLSFNAGANLRFLLNDITGTALHLGGWARPVRNADNTTELDAVVTMIGIEHQNFLLGFSYDISPGQFTLNTRSRNAFEISVAYLGEYEDETVLCPKF
ncbi:MAG: type IX secretion system membrane protein PorP/SprF [Bacteroidetes bacterium]|nr:MAG: type IX secretion system membrane protein PorP/SprF [Bacteroidota bacterium]